MNSIYFCFLKGYTLNSVVAARFLNQQAEKSLKKKKCHSLQLSGAFAMLPSLIKTE